MLEFPRIDPVALGFGPLKVRWYGLMYMIGFAAAWLLGRYRAAKPGSGWKPADVNDLVAYSMLGLIIGARLGYALFYDFPTFAAAPLEVVKIWKGGMSFHGGLVGVCLGLWLFCRRTGRGFFQVTDFLVPLTPIGLFTGRIGNFINAELWGRVTDKPWGMVFPGRNAGSLPRHPSQLYEAFLEGMVLFAVLWIFSAKPRPRKAVSGLFLFCYGLFRFSLEFVREPDPQLGFIAFGWMSMGQLLCLPMVLLGMVLLYLAYFRGQKPEAG